MNEIESFDRTKDKNYDKMFSFLNETSEDVKKRDNEREKFDMKYVPKVIKGTEFNISMLNIGDIVEIKYPNPDVPIEQEMVTEITSEQTILTKSYVSKEGFICGIKADIFSPSTKIVKIYKKFKDLFYLYWMDEKD